eukprot:3904066-Prymnesium_polylepis.1
MPPGAGGKARSVEPHRRMRGRAGCGLRVPTTAVHPQTDTPTAPFGASSTSRGSPGQRCPTT